MTAIEKLHYSLSRMGYMLMWMDNGHERNNTYSLYMRQPSKKVGSPIKLVLVMEYPYGNGFEVFHSAADENDITADIDALKAYTARPIKPLHQL